MRLDDLDIEAVGASRNRDLDGGASAILRFDNVGRRDVGDRGCFDVFGLIPLKDSPGLRDDGANDVTELVLLFSEGRLEELIEVMWLRIRSGSSMEGAVGWAS